jgi:hypothetical protein
MRRVIGTHRSIGHARKHKSPLEINNKKSNEDEKENFPGIPIIFKDYN